MTTADNNSQPNRETLLDLVLTSAEEIISMTNGDPAGEQVLNADSPLIGQGAVLDSMGLVTLIVEVEQRLEEEQGIMVVLADDRAMSQKNSPFRSINSLTDYLQQLVREAS